VIATPLMRPLFQRRQRICSCRPNMPCQKKPCLGSLEAQQTDPLIAPLPSPGNTSALLHRHGRSAEVLLTNGRNIPRSANPFSEPRAVRDGGIAVRDDRLWLPGLFELRAVSAPRPPGADCRARNRPEPINYQTPSFRAYLPPDGTRGDHTTRTVLSAARRNASRMRKAFRATRHPYSLHPGCEQRPVSVHRRNKWRSDLSNCTSRATNLT